MIKRMVYFFTEIINYLRISINGWLGAIDGVYIFDQILTLLGWVIIATIVISFGFWLIRKYTD